MNKYHTLIPNVMTSYMGKYYGPDYMKCGYCGCVDKLYNFDGKQFKLPLHQRGSEITRHPILFSCPNDDCGITLEAKMMKDK